MSLNVDDNKGNELDVVFTKGNKLFVIECKTGFQKETMLKDIAYKASAINSMLRGLTVYSFICTMQNEDGRNEDYVKICKNMNIEYVGRNVLMNENERDDLFKNIVFLSHD